MNLFVRIILGLLACLVLLVATGAFFMRESLGSQARFDYRSPRFSKYHVEIYEWPGFGGDPAFSLFVVDSGVQKYLGDIDAGPHSVWAENLRWSNDGAMIYCGNGNDRTAYLFGEDKLIRGSARDLEGEVDALLLQHGGPGPSFFHWKADPAICVWRDFVPREAY